MRRSYWSSLALCALLGVAPLGSSLLGCATDGYPGPRPVLEAGVAENPPDGPAVRIAVARDRRDFSKLGGLTPDGDRDPVEQSRVLAQGTGPSGTNGVVLQLPPDLAVEMLGAEAMVRALRAAGFRVLEQGEEDYERALPLEVDVEQMWLGRNPRGAPAHATYEIRLRVRGPVAGMESGIVADVNGKVSRGGWSRALWRMALEKGLDEATEEAQIELTAVAGSLAREAGIGPLAPGASFDPESEMPPTPVHEGGPVDFLFVRVLEEEPVDR